MAYKNTNKLLTVQLDESIQLMNRAEAAKMASGECEVNEKRNACISYVISMKYFYQWFPGFDYSK